MDSTVWSQLPEELLDRILSFLPLNSFLILRSTCKHFKSLIFSPTFMSKHSSSSSSSSSPSSSFLLLSHPQLHQRYSYYDTIAHSWRNSSLSISPLLSCPPSTTLLCISNGLLCYSLPSSSSFVIYNFLASSSRVLSFPSHPFAFEFLTLVSTSVGYRVFLISSKSGSSKNVFVYDSRVHLWQQYEGFKALICDNYIQEGVFCDGFLYFITPEPFSVVSFEMETGKWDRSVTELPGRLMFIRLVSDGDGKLYLFGGIGTNGISRSLKLWELSGGGQNWVEVGSVPELMCKKFVCVCYHKYEYIYIFWHQGMICLCCYTWPEILYYKVSRSTWHWVPKCPSLPEKWSCGFRWFSFVPELCAYV
ncbi:hypothetical protein RJ639_047892 [Escallonia herrerae]|uniref:F-box domain-containing protein n=1 Tax=Escallonia herrerae TaxID=1293975 RepID=A0AA88W7J1_9ASTE|nr:hypothetical protein RJ639_047892 [Escallonia herrerae]